MSFFTEGVKLNINLTLKIGQFIQIQFNFALQILKCLQQNFINFKQHIMFEVFGSLSSGLAIAFVACLIMVFFFEFVNGFHDTANAVATVIYTKSLEPMHAVVWSGMWNFLGVIFSSFLGLEVAIAYEAGFKVGNGAWQS